LLVSDVRERVVLPWAAQVWSGRRRGSPGAEIVVTAQREASRIEFAPPPTDVVRAVNVVCRRLLPTPVGRLIPLALLEFRGRRSGRTFRVPVGWHPAPGGHVVVSQGTWPKNFVGGHEAHWLRGTYVDDPEQVAAAFRAIVAEGTSPRALALRVPDGQQIAAADMARLHRSIIRFTV
jgi:hypothetical protein